MPLSSILSLPLKMPSFLPAFQKVIAQTLLCTASDEDHLCPNTLSPTDGAFARVLSAARKPRTTAIQCPLSVQGHWPAQKSSSAKSSHAASHMEIPPGRTVCTQPEDKQDRSWALCRYERPPSPCRCTISTTSLCGQQNSCASKGLGPVIATWALQEIKQRVELWEQNSQGTEGS